MAQAMNVRVPVTALISALEARLVEYRKYMTDAPRRKANEEKHDKEMEAWRRALCDSPSATIVEISEASWRSKKDGFHVVDVCYAIKETPKNSPPIAPKQSLPRGISYDRDLTDAIETIESTVRLLSMSSEETVSASAYKSVARYL
jgi:hypothetical protein